MAGAGCERAHTGAIRDWARGPVPCLGYPTLSRMGGRGRSSAGASGSGHRFADDFDPPGLPARRVKAMALVGANLPDERDALQATGDGDSHPTEPLALAASGRRVQDDRALGRGSDCSSSSGSGRDLDGPPGLSLHRPARPTTRRRTLIQIERDTDRVRGLRRAFGFAGSGASAGPQQSCLVIGNSPETSSAGLSCDAATRRGPCRDPAEPYDAGGLSASWPSRGGSRSVVQVAIRMRLERCRPDREARFRKHV